jgi:high-affinity iron transporter
MLSTAIIIFREILEIAMILGVVLAATRGLPGRATWIAGGFFSGLAGAALVAVFAKAISQAASGMGQEFFNAMILFTAAIVIGWTAVWVRTHAREMVAQFREMGKEVAAGKLPGLSLAIVIGLAILREGSEIVLFIYGMIVSGQTASSIVIGSIIGITLGTIVGFMLYFGLIKMSAKYMLKVTGWLLVLLVAGLSSQGAGYLSAAGYFDHLSTPLWNTSWLLSEDGIVGKSLHSLIGYSARPYVGTLVGIVSLIAYIDRNKQPLVAMTATVLISVFLMGSPAPAHALDEIYSPNVEYRELSFEWNLAVLYN